MAKSICEAAAAVALDGFGHFHKTLPHNEYGEVETDAFEVFYDTCQKRRVDGPLVNAFANTPPGMPVLPPPDLKPAQLTNPLAGLALDPLVPSPETFTMPAPPSVTSISTAAEMTELYWMAILRDLPFDQWATPPDGTPDQKLLFKAVPELNSVFKKAVEDPSTTDGMRLKRGTDVPCGDFTADTLFRLGYPGDDVGPMVSQFWLRDIAFGTQTIDQKQMPYRRGLNYLTDFRDWLHCQNTGRGPDGSDYPKSNEVSPINSLEGPKRHISCMRDLARFVNKDALHQAYFNAALLLLNSGARWTPGNPYAAPGRRDAGFGTLGGPHILALVSEVATRGLQTVWFQKWQTWLRLRPEAYAGHLHVQELIAPNVVPPKASYGLKATGLFGMVARTEIMNRNGGTLLLPMAFTAGSPAHPAYGAGHATVAGVCVTILKAYFQTLENDDPTKPIKLSTLTNFPTFIPGINAAGEGTLNYKQFLKMTIEGELNKLAQNVAMGRSMGGVHWRSDNTRSLALGEALAAHVLFKVAGDLAEKPTFVFRTFGRVCGEEPKVVKIGTGQDGKVHLWIGDAEYKLTDDDGCSLSDLLNPPNQYRVGDGCPLDAMPGSTPVPMAKPAAAIPLNKTKSKRRN